MLSTQNFKNRLVVLQPMTLSYLRHSFQNWIREQIVDDDPYDIETLFPTVSRFYAREKVLQHAYLQRMDTDYN